MEPENVNEEVNVVDEPIAVEEAPNETAFGIVSCEALNVREAPDVESNAITVLHKDSEVMIDMNMSTEEFYSICTEAGVEGFCMRQFIEVE